MAETAPSTATSNTSDSVILYLTDFKLPPSLSASTTPIRHLTLTSDIPLATLSSAPTAHLTSGFTLTPSLPASVKTLSLTNFTFGYPPGFLTALAGILPEGLQEVRLGLQLIAGTTAESFHDAVVFIKSVLAKVERLTLMDVFVPPDFWGAVTAEADKGVECTRLKELEISYTFRYSDQAFHENLPLSSLAGLIRSLHKSSLETLAVRIIPESNEAGASAGGMMPCEETIGSDVMSAVLDLPKEGRVLKRLDLTVAVIDTEKLGEVVSRFSEGLEEICIAVEAGTGTGTEKKGVLEMLGKAKGLRGVEVVVRPGMEFYEALRKDKVAALSSVLYSREEVESLQSRLPNLNSVDVSILKVPQLGYSQWVRQNEAWEGEVSYGADLSENEKAQIEAKKKEAMEKERMAGQRVVEIA